MILVAHAGLLARVIHDTSEGVGILGDFFVSAGSLNEYT